MAKRGVVLECDPTVGAKAKVKELKKELQRIVKCIVEEEEEEYCCESSIDAAKETLSLLKEFNLKLRKRSSTSLSLTLRSKSEVSAASPSPSPSPSPSWPQHLKCPLSKQLMRDPVIVASGQTYERRMIEKWLKAGNRTCPRTQQVLSHTVLTPNHLIREMIEQWCQNQGIQLSNTNHENGQGIAEAEAEADEHHHFLSLLDKMSSSTLSEHKAAAKELRLLTKKMPSFRVLFGETSHAIPKLLKPISGSDSLGNTNNLHLDLQEDVITTLMNISIHDNNKKLVAETPMVIPLLMKALRSGTIETRSNAAAALFTLSALDSNKQLIGKAGALKPLIDLLEEGHPLAMKDVASAIFSLCFIHENKVRAVKEGAVRVIVRKIMDRLHVDELLAILALLSSHQKAVEDMGEMGGVACLLSIVRESKCERNKENCIAILQTLCLYDRTRLKDIKQEENNHRTISQLALNGTSRAKRKATQILETLNRVVNITHTA